MNIDPNEVLPILRDCGDWPPSGEEAALIDEYKAKNKVRDKVREKVKMNMLECLYVCI
jgi:hypothetical protein